MVRTKITKGSGVDGGPPFRKGSVLMEFVVVAPLYFILLGGLFMVGDLVVNRVRFHIGEHFVTWVGASRHRPPGKTKEEQANKIKALVKPMYDLSIAGAIDNAGFRIDTPNPSTEQIFHNSFMQFYMGRINQLPINMPEWARGMLEMENAMQGNANMDEYSTVNFKTKEVVFHSFSFHRRELSGIDNDIFDNYSRSKDVSAGQLATDEDNILSNVITGERWVNELSEENGGEPNPKLSFERRDSDEVLRYLGPFAQ